MSELRCGTCGELEYPKWISVKDEFPQHNEFVLAVGTDRIIEILRCSLIINDDRHFTYLFMTPDLSHNHQVNGVTHWMELPEPPRIEKL